jgi:hypothetical protein
MAMHLRLYVQLAILAMASAVAGGVLALVAAWLLQPGPPIRIYSGQALTPQVQAGSDVVMRFDLRRTRPCPAVIHGFLVGADGRAITRYPPEIGGYSEVGHKSVTVSRPIPIDAAGRVCYRHTRIDSCEAGNFVATGPDVCFDVAPRVDP